MDKLTLKEILPYVGTGLKVIDTYDGNIKELIGIISEVQDECMISCNGVISNRYLDEIKPIFKPIDFIETDNFSEVSNMDELEKSALKSYGIDSGRLSYKNLKILCSMHIDICKTIPRGLAISTDTLGKEDKDYEQNNTRSCKS
ncbi:hypothetical protein OHD16_06820 [Sphingobacterium sp. ML3W]|uniref:hypothetical protein n=1 Tax=Sphingobacterium sp. ML3W TaxID=1538644 RepID=UPI00249BF3A1|nr:hypothetical protein [Sphingobacterium sp. ML3W]WFA79682.1 hypothetical protein OGI71_27060 [Sphingobacterium sp. ML3W]